MRLNFLALASVVLALPLSAHADILGDTIHVQYDYPDMNTLYGTVGDFTVPATGNAFGIATFTLSANQIIITADQDYGFLNTSFNGLEFTDITKDPALTGVTLDPLSTVAGSAISFTSDSVAVNFAGLNIQQGQDVILDLDFTPPAAAVTPEPSSFALLGTGLVGVAGVMRKRFSRA